MVEPAAPFILNQLSIIKSNNSDLHSRELKCCQRGQAMTVHVLSAYIDRHESGVDLLSSIKNYNSQAGSKLARRRGNCGEIQSGPESGLSLGRRQSQEGQRRLKPTEFEEIPRRKAKDEGSQPHEGSDPVRAAAYSPATPPRPSIDPAKGIPAKFLQAYKDRKTISTPNQLSTSS
ncbi:MAG: hypothetical protein M1840_004823 [Geoglossum simile]|nr:MAG: hypothetical protein M1840_004823 [Geoglossum simile]